MNLYAQHGINYKAVLTDNGNLLQNQQVTLRFSILENGTSLIYEEIHTTTTDINGIVLANIGEGTVNLGTFITINWGNPQSLRVEVNSGGGYINMGTTQMKYVPYAKFATKALDANDHDFYKLGTSIKATSNSEDIYHMGKIGVGDIPFNAQLQVRATSSLYSINSSNTTNSNSNVVGIFSQLSGNGTGNRTSTENRLTGEASGIQYGTMNWIDNSGNNTHFGVRNSLFGSGSGLHKGTYNELFGTGSGEQVGSHQYIYNPNGAAHYGILNDLNGSGSGDHIGEYNNLYGSGNGYQYGNYNTISNSGNGSHYGVMVQMQGTGSGNKYGVYSIIPTTTGGYHIAVYAKAEKAGSYAGYFQGNVFTSGKLTTTASGDADMKAYLYGNVNPTGAVSNACSSGFSVAKQSTGTYRITFTTPMSASAYVITGNVLSTLPRILTYNPSNNYVDIYVWNIAGGLADEFFNFVIYKK